MTRVRDRRDMRLARAYRANALECAIFGHDYWPDIWLDGDYACGWCRAARSLTPPQDNDKIHEVTPRGAGS